MQKQNPLQLLMYIYNCFRAEARSYGLYILHKLQLKSCVLTDVLFLAFSHEKSDHPKLVIFIQFNQ